MEKVLFCPVLNNSHINMESILKQNWGISFPFDGTRTQTHTYTYKDLDRLTTHQYYLQLGYII